ncbi:potassium channel family protein [Thermodesulfobacteriota bacterium]
MKQFVIIGLGNLGYYLATHLYDKGHEVLAIDINSNRIQEIKDRVGQAVVADATDRKVVESLGVDRMDAAVVCTGSDLSASILITLNLKDIGVQKVYAKAISEPHGRILNKIGSLEVIFPEKDQAIALAERLHNPNILDYLPFVEGYSIVEFAPTANFIGKNLMTLDLINRFGVQVLGVKELVPERLNMIPTGAYVVKDSDILILLGPNDGLEALRKKMA